MNLDYFLQTWGRYLTDITSNGFTIPQLNVVVTFAVTHERGTYYRDATYTTTLYIFDWAKITTWEQLDTLMTLTFGEQHENNV